MSTVCLEAAIPLKSYPGFGFVGPVSQDKHFDAVFQGGHYKARNSVL